MRSHPALRVRKFVAVRLATLFAAACATVATCFAGATKVYLIAGQSNADGRGPSSGLPAPYSAPQEDIPIYYGLSESSPKGGKYPFIEEGKLTTLRPNISGQQGKIGPELTFGRSMADFHAAKGESIALIKYAVGGTSLATDWKPGGSASTSGDGGSYKNFQKVVDDGMKALKESDRLGEFEFAGVIWMQGESDSKPETSRDYERNLKRFIADFRRTFGSNLPFIIGRLSTGQTNGLSVPDRDVVIAAQQAVAKSLPATGLVNTDALELGKDRLHFTQAGQLGLGEVFASEMQRVVSQEIR